MTWLKNTSCTTVPDKNEVMTKSWLIRQKMNDNEGREAPIYPFVEKEFTGNKG